MRPDSIIKPFFVFIIIFLFISSGFSQLTTKPIEKEHSFYSGGMLVLQAGYSIAENKHQTIHDFSFGVGGILRFYVYKHLTVGIYGGTLRTNYTSTNSKNSYINLGYGGSFVGFSMKKNKIRYTVSAYVGGGSIKNLHIENQSKNTLLNSYLYKTPTCVFSPILSIDYAIHQKISLTCQGVCLISVNKSSKPLYNPCFQLGILFNH